MTPTRSTTWSAARQRQALDLSARYRHGASVPELARDTGLSKGTVINRLRLVGTPMRTPQQTRLLQQAAARLALANTMRRWYESGTSIPALAAIFECSPRTARRLLAHVNTQVRSPSQTRALGSDGQARRDLMQTLRTRYEAGVSVQLLAAGCGYSTSTVYRLLHQAGAAVRPRSQPHPRTRGDRSPGAPLNPFPPPAGTEATPSIASSHSTAHPIDRIGSTS